jgi:hypothetical protein
MGAVHSCVRRREGISVAELNQALTVWQEEKGLTAAERSRRAAIKELLITRQTGAAPYCNLSYFYITTIPTCLGWFKHLTKLNLSHNALVELPTCIGEFFQLQHLDVSHNGLRALPASIGLLSQLRILEVQYNNLEALPAALARLRYLQKVDAFDNPALRLSAELKTNSLFKRVSTQSPAGIWRICKDLIKELDETDGMYADRSPWLGRGNIGKRIFTYFIAKFEELNKIPSSEEELQIVLRINIILLGMQSSPMIRSAMYQTSCQLYELERGMVNFPACLILQCLEQAYLSASSEAKEFQTLLRISRQILAVSRAEQFINEYYSSAEHDNYPHFRLSMLSGFRSYLGQLHRLDLLDEETASFFSWVKPVKSALRIPLSHIKAMTEFVVHPDEKSKTCFAEKLYQVYFWQSYFLGEYKKDPTITDEYLYEAFEAIKYAGEESAENALWTAPSLDPEETREWIMKNTFVYVLKNYL